MSSCSIPSYLKSVLPCWMLLTKTELGIVGTMDKHCKKNKSPFLIKSAITLKNESSISMNLFSITQDFSYKNIVPLMMFTTVYSSFNALETVEKQQESVTVKLWPTSKPQFWHNINTNKLKWPMTKPKLLSLWSKKLYDGHQTYLIQSGHGVQLWFPALSAV